MNVVPAQEAGVGSVALASPPQREFGGRVHPTILGAAGLLGVTEVYAMGGAGAIGALAYGVPDLALDPVDVITGPGNIFVAAAKRLVQGQSWGSTPRPGPPRSWSSRTPAPMPRLVAADLVSQAEHDELRRGRARHRLVRSSPTAVQAVARSGSPQAPRHAERASSRPWAGRSRRSCSSTTSRRRRRSATRTDPSTSRSRPRDPESLLDAHRQRRRDLPRCVRPGEPRRLSGRVEPRAADGRPVAVLLGPRRLHVPPAAAGHPLRRAGAPSRSSGHIVALSRRGGPAGARRGGRRSGSPMRESVAATRRARAYPRGAPMFCPFCRHPDSRVIDSRTSDDGLAIRRRRQCPECGRRF